MAINPDAVGVRGTPTVTSWTTKDSLIYSLGVGAGPEELAFVTENSIGVDQRALPTMAVTLADATTVFGSIGSFNPVMLVHGEQRVELHSELPVSGSVSTVAEITGIYDKGKGALIEITAVSSDATSGEPRFTTMMSAYIRGEGGFGGDRGPSNEAEMPTTAPDFEIHAQTAANQALIYRLAGDRNPLHSDPTFAGFAGFDRPILHGLCTFGFAGRALLHTLCAGDPARFHGIAGRFTSPVFPGEALSTRIWVSEGKAEFQTLGEDGRVVLNHGHFTYA
ncbi:MAG TPA: enoyl-CoA hydratase [Acidimicrobiaceae bacterium]|nr:enoyl-CoA hydratase [Acidimicrobiaceae bacterium]